MAGGLRADEDYIADATEDLSCLRDTIIDVLTSLFRLRGALRRVTVDPAYSDLEHVIFSWLAQLMRNCSRSFRRARRRIARLLRRLFELGMKRGITI